MAALGRIVVVLGAAAGAVRDGVSFGRAEVVVCETWATGQAASLRRGLQALEGAGQVVVTLGDAPLVSAEVVALVAAAPAPARALYDGRPGHPVVLGAGQIAAVMELSGDQGARGLLRGARTIEVGHLCHGGDVDTPEDLAAVRALAAARR